MLHIDKNAGAYYSKQALMKRVRRNTGAFWVIAWPAFGVLVVMLFGIDVVRIQGRSMEPTIDAGQIVIVNTAAYGVRNPLTDSYLLQWEKPEKNDIVVFRSPLDGRMAVKRCVSTGGDPLVSQDHMLRLDGTSYRVASSVYYLMRPLSKVPADSLFVVGDDPALSVDSRQYGFVLTRAVRGKVVLRLPGRRGKQPVATVEEQ